MKFEIDDKTGRIMGLEMDLIKYYTSDIGTWDITKEQLEQILQAVKKTQEKLVNRQIQEIQDSKNFPNGIITNRPIHFETIPSKEKIEQNQKIVDKLVNFCNIVNIAEENSGTDNFINNIEHVHVSSLTIQDLIREATGKDIGELK